MVRNQINDLIIVKKYIKYRRENMQWNYFLNRNKSTIHYNNIIINKYNSDKNIPNNIYCYIYCYIYIYIYIDNKKSICIYFKINDCYWF